MDGNQSCIRLDSWGVTSRSATLLPPCTFVMYLTLVTSALGVTLARILGLGHRGQLCSLGSAIVGSWSCSQCGISALLLTFLSPSSLLLSPFFSPFSLPPDNLNSGDLIKMSTQLFFFLPFPHHAFNHRSLFREKYVLSQRHMWVWKSELSKAFLQVKKTANSFCNILSSSGDLCEAQGVLYIHLKLKQSWKTSKILQLLGGVGVNGQVHTKAKLSWVVFLSCFIIVKAGLGDRKLPRKRERRVGNGNSEASGFPGISPVAAPSCLVARFWQRFRSWVSVDCQASAVSHLRSG